MRARFAVFCFKSPLEGKKMLRGLKMLVTLNMKLALVNPKTWRKAAEKRNSHTQPIQQWA